MRKCPITRPTWGKFTSMSELPVSIQVFEEPAQVSKRQADTRYLEETIGHPVLSARTLFPCRRLVGTTFALTGGLRGI